MRFLAGYFTFLSILATFLLLGCEKTDKTAAVGGAATSIPDGTYSFAAPKCTSNDTTLVYPLDGLAAMADDYKSLTAAKRPHIDATQ